MVDYHTRRKPIDWEFVAYGFACGYIVVEVFWDVISFFLWGS